MARKTTVRITGRAHPDGNYWEVSVSGKPLSSVGGRHRAYECALAFVEGYTLTDGLLDEYKRTGKAKYEFQFDREAARRRIFGAQ